MEIAGAIPVRRGQADAAQLEIQDSCQEEHKSALFMRKKRKEGEEGRVGDESAEVSVLRRTE
jgi:hypothetical protein